MKRNALTIGVAVLALGIAAQSSAQIKVNHQVGRPENFNKVMPRNGLSAQDKAFLRSASIFNISEVMAGKIAMRRGGSWSQMFGEDLVREHTLAQEELKQLAAKKGFRLPNTVPNKDRMMLARLENVSSSGFDALFRKMMMKSHSTAELLVAKEIKRGYDSTVRGFATKMLASVDGHHKMAMHKDTMMARSDYTSGSAAQRIRN